MTIFESAEIKDNEIVIDGKSHPLVEGKHELWIPDIGLKLVWSFNGKIESYKDWELGKNKEAIISQQFNSENEGFDFVSLESILQEYSIFEMLAKKRMSPPVGDLCYIKNIISYFPNGAKHCDPKGIYGFFIEDANKLEKGDFSVDKFIKEFVTTQLIIISKTALGDLRKANNVVNGYLVDVRRTLWDMMQVTTYSNIEEVAYFMSYVEDVKELKERISKLGQFPYKQRKQNYESYWLKDRYEDGSRDTLYRFEKMKISKDLTGKTVLDLGCQLGAVSMEAYRRGARWVSGIDNEKDYITCARDLCRVNGFQINFLKMNLNRPMEVIAWANSYYKKPIDIIFALALFKHIRTNLWVLLRGLDWRVCYVESHNAPAGLEDEHVKLMLNEFKGLNCKVDYLEMINDRSPRVIWRLEKG